jgi:hypothetical protein
MCAGKAQTGLPWLTPGFRFKIPWNGNGLQAIASLEETPERLADMTWDSRRIAAFIIKGIFLLFLVAIFAMLSLFHEWSYGTKKDFAVLSGDEWLQAPTTGLPLSEDTPGALIETYITKLDAIMADDLWQDTEEMEEKLQSLAMEYGPRLGALEETDAVEAAMTYSWAMTQMKNVSNQLNRHPHSGGSHPRLHFQPNHYQLALLEEIAKKERERALRECN